MGKLLDIITVVISLCILLIAIPIVGVIHLLTLIIKGLFSLVTVSKQDPQCEKCEKLWKGCSCDSEDMKECFVPNDEGNEE